MPENSISYCWGEFQKFSESINLLSRYHPKAYKPWISCSVLIKLILWTNEQLWKKYSLRSFLNKKNSPGAWPEDGVVWPPLGSPALVRDAGWGQRVPAGGDFPLKDRRSCPGPTFLNSPVCPCCPCEQSTFQSSVGVIGMIPSLIELSICLSSGRLPSSVPKHCFENRVLLA